MPYKDQAVRKEKQAQYSKKYYENNKKHLITKASNRRKTQTLKFAEFKATKSCIKCGENHPATFDFHHVVRHPDNKKVSKLLQSHNYGAARKEIQKCIVLCANCHRIEHGKEI